jgi:hypothetical protein
MIDTRLFVKILGFLSQNELSGRIVTWEIWRRR